MHTLCRTFVRIVVLSLVVLPPVAVAADDDATATSRPLRKHRHATSAKPKDSVVHGKASYYARSLAGRKTASGERYDPNAMTAAHRTLPLGTQLKVTNPKTDKTVVVTVNDRGPVPKDRMVDLSNAAAKELGMTKAGTAQVEAEVVGKNGVAAEK